MIANSRCSLGFTIAYTKASSSSKIKHHGTRALYTKTLLKMAAMKPKSTPKNKNHGAISHKSKTKMKSQGNRNPNLIPLGKNSLVSDMRNKKEVVKPENKKIKKSKQSSSDVGSSSILISTSPAEEQLKYFLHCFQSSNGFKLSPLELEAFKDTCMVELSSTMNQDVDNLSHHVKSIFKNSWKNELCDGKLSKGNADAGSPAIIVICSSALRSLELLRGLRPLTKECQPVKLFAKHIKVEEQVTLLKDRVNIACGTPSRIKKLIDMEALSLSRLQIMVLDMQKDVKGFNLFSLQQVSKEFWDLYKRYFNERLQQCQSRICFYGPVSQAEIKKIDQSDK